MRKPIRLEDAPKELQERIQKHVEKGFELLGVLKEEDVTLTGTYEASLATSDSDTIINLLCLSTGSKKFYINERRVDIWGVIEALRVSEPFRKRIKSHLRTIERDIERKEKEQSE